LLTSVVTWRIALSIARNLTFTDPVLPLLSTDNSSKSTFVQPNKFYTKTSYKSVADVFDLDMLFILANELELHHSDKIEFLQDSNY
jgi:hypothetical protein